MRAVVVHEFGPPQSLDLAEIADPIPNADEVLVSIRATAVNFVDLLVIEGKYQFLPQRPFAPGKLPAGVIAAVGANVTELHIGDRVLTFAEQGGFAEMVAVPAKLCYPLPDSMPFTDVASLSLAFDTAWMALHERARTQAGETVLVLGASGAVGQAAVQLAKYMGARVIAGVNSPEKAAVVQQLGADAVVYQQAADLRESLRQQIYGVNNGKGVDVILDPLGGDVFDAAIRGLAWRGRLVIIGFAAGRIPQLKVNYLLLKNIEVSGLQISDYRRRTPELMRQCLADIFEGYLTGKLRPEPVRSFALHEFTQAAASVRDRTAGGRVVLEPGR